MTFLYQQTLLQQATLFILIIMKHPPYSETGVSLHYTGAFLDARGNRNLPRFRKGILADLALAEKPYRAVNARDHDAERQGLKEFLRLETTDGKPIYIVDEHHHALSLRMLHIFQ